MYSQKRFTFFPIILLNLQQPTITPLPKKRRCIRVFTALSAHVQFNILGTDGATKLWIRKNREKHELLLCLAKIMSEKRIYSQTETWMYNGLQSRRKHGLN